MKTKKMISKKIIVSALSTTMGVSLVGAISGTVAWYQYSTRSTVSYVGTSVATSENLLVSLSENSGYHNDIGHSEVASALQSQTELAPVTSGAMDEGDALPTLKAQPIYQKFGYDNWLNAKASSFVQFTVYIKLNQLDNTGAQVAVTEQRKVYLSDLLIQNDTNNTTKNDMSDAIRVHLSSKHENMLLSKTGEETEVNGKLDLNGDTRLDTADPAYSFIDYDPDNAVPYGGGVQKAYKLADVKDMANGHYLGKLNSAKAVTFEATEDFEDGVTYYDDEAMSNETQDEHASATKTYYVLQEALPVTVTIWLEGWQKLTASSTAVQVEAGGSLAGLFEDAQCTKPASGNAAQAGTYYKDPVKEAMWDPAKYIGAIFDVGLMFEVETNNN